MESNLIMPLYEWSTWEIVTVVLGLMLVCNEIGFRVGRRGLGKESELSRTVSNALKGSIFGLVALLLAFSFSATTSRYDLRQRIVLDQSNAVGTCYLRASLLDEKLKNQIQKLLRRYVDLRLQLHQVGHDAEQNAQIQGDIDKALADLWSNVEEAYQADPEKVRNILLIPSANEVIDLSSTRAWASRNHLPEPVIFLLLVSVLVSSALLGHSSGQSGRRHIGLWMASNAVFALVLFIVLDFDRPRRGLIRIDQTPLIELKQSLANPPQ